MKDKFPHFPDWKSKYTDFYPHKTDWEKMTVEQLKECWSVCEQQKRYCHPESVYQPLIDKDMREIAQVLKARKRVKPNANE